MSVPHAILVAVGDELSSGRRPDANGEKLARWLESLGCEVAERRLVPDTPAAIERAIAETLAVAPDVVIVTGGLGPTEDDRTREALARACAAPLELDRAALAAIEQRYRERGREVPATAARQALRPAGGEGIANPIGTAPGFLLRCGHTLLIALPGVPREMTAMMERTVLPLLRRALGAQTTMHTRTLRVVGLPESEVDRLLEGVFAPERLVKLSLLAQHGEVQVFVTIRAADDERATRDLDAAAQAVRDRLAEHVHSEEDRTLVEALQVELDRRQYTLGVAESLTGGLLAKRITDLPGASAFFRGAIVAYVNAEKEALLGVAPDLLDRFGPVSGEVAYAMAVGARERLSVDVALATTGIAGPAGGTADKPVGLVFLAVAWPDGVLVTRHVFTGDRGSIRVWATVSAIDQARRVLQGLPLKGEVVDLQHLRGAS